jgi:hypothetical protein
VGITTSHNADDVLIDRVEIYRNGQDAIRVSADNLTLRNSYIHDHYCNHPDGIQAFVPTNNSGVGTSEQVISNLTIIGNIFEKVGLQDVFLGENSTHQSWVNGALIRDNLFLGCVYCIKTKHGNSTNFVIEQNTFVSSSEFVVEWCCSNPGSKVPMTIRNNIFVNTKPGDTAFYLPTGGGNTTFTGNCLYQSGGLAGQYANSGTITSNPLFVGGGDYALQQGSPCAGKGSILTSVSMLFGQVAPTATQVPSATLLPTETPLPTDAPSATIQPTATETATNPPPVPTATEYFLDCRVTLRSGIPIGIDCP